MSTRRRTPERPDADGMRDGVEPTTERDGDVVDVADLIGGAGPPPPRRRRRRRRVVGALLVLVLVALVAEAVAAFLTLRSARVDLLTAQSLLEGGSERLRDADAEQAAADFEEAVRRITVARRRLRAAPLDAAAVVPWVARNIEAIDGVAGAARIAAAAAERVARAVLALPGGVAALAPQDGALPVDALAAIAPELRVAEQELQEARSAAEEAPSVGVVGDVRESRAQLIDQLDEVIGPVATLASIAEVLPPFLGAEGPRRYFLGSSNPTELRASGGFIGAFTILTVDGGQLRFDDFRPIQDLPVLAPDAVEAADPSLLVRYARFGGTGAFRNLNLTPDFPSAAIGFERLYEAVEGIALDGVILVDPFAFEALLSVTGPVEVPGIGTIGAEDVVAFVSNEAYAELEDDDERKALIGRVATAAFTRFLDGAEPGEVVELARSIGELADRGSLLVHSVHAQEQAALAALGVDGALPNPEGDLLAVFANSGTASKVDYYSRRALRYDVSLSTDGSAASTLVATFRNDAPSEGQPTYVIGPNTPILGPGEQLLWVSAYGSAAAELLDVPDEGWDGLPTEEGIELGHPVASTWLLVPPGQSRELLWTMLTPGAWAEGVGGDWTYRLTYDHQAQVAPTTLDLQIRVPGGFEPTDLPDGATFDDGTVRWSAEVDRDHELEVRFSIAS